MTNSLATLFLLVSSILLCCAVVEYSVIVSKNTLSGDLPEMDRIKQLNDTIKNQTANLLNQTLTDWNITQS